MSSWRVSEWSDTEGTGVVMGDVGPLPFSRAHALVESFIVGEEVDVVLEDEEGAIVARDVAPVAWRENAPILEPPSLPDEIAERLTRLGRVFGPHARTQIVFAKEDVLQLELHDVDWPPPVTPPLATIQFEGVFYVKAPSFSESYARVTAIPWPVYRAARKVLLAYWSLAPDFVPDEAFVFRFEPKRFRETAGYVIASSIEVTATAGRVG